MACKRPQWVESCRFRTSSPRVSDAGDGTGPKKSEFLISINSESNQAPIVAVPRVLAKAAREMAMTNNEAYYLRRAEQEEQAAIAAANPQAMTVHRDLAGRYRTRASEPEDGRHLKLVRD